MEKEITKMQECQLNEFFLINKINWDTNLSESEILNLIKNTDDCSNARISLFVKSLETFSWQELIFLWTYEEVDKLYNNKTRRMIFSKYLREEYDGVFEVLRNHSLSYTERSAEDYERFKSSILFNRRNRCKQRIFSSPLFR